LISKISSPLVRKYISNIIWGPFSNLAYGIINILVIPILISNLGSLNFGLVKVFELFTFNGLAGLLEFGTHATLIKLIAKEEALGKDKNKFFNASFYLLLVISSIVALLGFFTKNQLATKFGVSVDLAQREEFLTSISILFLIYPLMFTTLSFTGVLQGVHEISVVRKIEIGLNFLKSIFAAIIAVKTQSLIDVLTVYICFYLFNFIIQGFMCFRVINNLSLNPMYFSLRNATLILKSSGWFYINSLTGLSYRQLGTFFISTYWGPEAVAKYEIATKFPYFMKGVLGRINEIIVPLSSHLGVSVECEGGHKGLGEFFESILSIQLSISICVITYFFFNGESLLFFWIGDDAIELKDFLIISSSVLMLIPIANIGGGILLGSGINLKRLTFFAMFSVLINFLICKHLIVTFGMVVAIYGTISQYLVYGFLIHVFALRSFKIPYFKLTRNIILLFLIDSLIWYQVESYVKIDTKLIFIIVTVCTGFFIGLLNIFIVTPKNLRYEALKLIKEKVSRT